jgi:dCMP deaminase
MRVIDKWDGRFMALAQMVAQWSKDPSTQVGAVIVDDNRVVRGIGYNGFPRGIQDEPDRLSHRPTKYALTVHAEINAILNAHGGVKGCRLYVAPLPPCTDCAKFIIQAGIAEVVTMAITPVMRERWGESCDRGFWMFREAGIILSQIEQHPEGLDYVISR